MIKPRRDLGLWGVLIIVALLGASGGAFAALTLRPAGPPDSRRHVPAETVIPRRLPPPEIPMPGAKPTRRVIVVPVAASA